MDLANSEILSEARNGKQWMSVGGEGEEVCPGKMSERKTPLPQVRDERDFFHVVCMPRKWRRPAAEGGYHAK